MAIAPSRSRASSDGHESARSKGGSAGDSDGGRPNSGSWVLPGCGRQLGFSDRCGLELMSRFLNSEGSADQTSGISIAYVLPSDGGKKKEEEEDGEGGEEGEEEEHKEGEEGEEQEEKEGEEAGGGGGRRMRGAGGKDDDEKEEKKEEGTEPVMARALVRPVDEAQKPAESCAQPAYRRQDFRGGVH